MTTGATSASPVGTYAITVIQGSLSAANYDFTAFVNGVLSVGKAHLTVTAGNQTMTYGGTVPTPTYTITGFVNGDTPAVVNGTPALTPGATSASPVGTYSITVSQGSLSATNYDFSKLVNGSLTVNRAHLTVTAASQSMTYGDAVPTPTYTITGFVNGDKQGVVSGNPVLTPGATSASPVGTYAITVTQGSMAAANYDFPNLVNGVLTVGKAHLTVTAADQSMTYGGAVPTPTYAITGFVNGDTQAVVSGDPVLTPGATSASLVGSYTTNVAQGTLSATNYDFPTFVNGTLVVNKAHLTVTADNKTKAPGSPNPPLTYTISGFVNGDTSSVVSGTASLSTTATTSSPAGVYSITVAVGTLTAANYDFPTFVNGTLTVVAQTNATVTVTPNNNPSVFGQAVTFAVKVSPATTGPVPTGSVQFQADGVNFGSAATLVNGAATSPAITTLGAGGHTIIAVYSGDTAYSSNSGSTIQTVKQAATTAAVVLSANPSVLGQAISFTVTVSAAAPGSGTPTGTVQFQVDGTNFGKAVALSNGSATSGAISTLKVGDHTITASYSGNANFATSTASLTQTVQKDDTTTNLVVTIGPSVYGQTISFTATVAAVAPATGTPTGSVTFLDDTTPLGTVGLTVGSATYTTTRLATGSHSITAVYNGSSKYDTSTSPDLTQGVNQDAATTVVTASANPSVFGQSVTFTATVSAAVPGSGTPTGSVTFLDGTTVLSTAQLSGGRARFSTKGLAIAGHTITAVYGGDTNFITSTSTVLNQVVNQDGTTALVSSSDNSSVSGQSVTFAASVSAAAPGSGTRTGTVTFLDGTTVLGTAPLTNGRGTLKVSNLAVGAHTITVVYGGDDNFTKSTSPAINQTVQKDATTTRLTSSDATAVSGQSVTFTAVVRAVAPGSGTPTGSVAFLDGLILLGTGTLDGTGRTTFTTSNLSLGAHPITAVYAGDDNFITSTSAGINQGVDQAITAIGVVSSANPSASGQSVTLTATVGVMAPGSGTPMGSVIFYDGSTVLGTVPVSASDGSPSLPNVTLAVGTHSIKVVYGGDANFKTSTSAVLKQVVTKQAMAAPLVMSASTVDLALNGLQDETTAGLIDSLAMEQVSSSTNGQQRGVQS